MSGWISHRIFRIGRPPLQTKSRILREVWHWDAVLLPLILLCTGLGGKQTPADSPCPGLLPTSTATDPEVQCAYRHIPYQTFSYTGEVRATWSSEYEILESYILADWEVVGFYTAGTTVALAIDTSKSRYDFVGRFRVVGTGEELSGITPIWCVTDPSIPALLEGCFGAVYSNGCSITEGTTCADSSEASVTCQGDGGTCSSSADEGDVGCQAGTTVTSTSTNGTKTTETALTKKRKACPRGS